MIYNWQPKTIAWQSCSTLLGLSEARRDTERVTWGSFGTAKRKSVTVMEENKHVEEAGTYWSSQRFSQGSLPGHHLHFMPLRLQAHAFPFTVEWT